MRSIAGIVHCDALPVDPNRIVRMLQPVRPLSEIVPSVGKLGHTCFGIRTASAIAEAAAKASPWIDATSRFLVIADARLDDRSALCSSLGLEPDAVDAELLLAAWKRWGRNCGDRLRGDFAFAIWDELNRELFGCRDPMGVRPFYYHFANEQFFAFASSAAGVLAAGGIPAELNETRVADAIVLETEGADQTSTFYKAVQRLPPAHSLLLRDGRISLERYWQPLRNQPAGLPTTEAAWLDAIRDALTNAIAKRMRGPGRVGSMLSGGLDSSTLVALAAGHCREHGLAPLSVFSVIHSGNPACAETAAVRAVGKALAIDARQVDAQDIEPFASDLRQWLQHIAEPFDACMGLVAAVYCLAARSGTYAVMDGVPADNLFAVGQYAGRQLRRGRLVSAWEMAVEHRRADGIAHPKLAALRLLAGYLAPDAFRHRRAQQREQADYHALLQQSLIDPAFAARAEFTARYRQYRQSLADSHAWDPQNRAMTSLGAPYITAGIERYHRVAGHFGVEPRPVYCDRDLIELFAWLPIRLRVRDGYWKWAMRCAVSEWLPHEVVWRRDRTHLGPAFSQRLFEDAFSADKMGRLSPYYDMRRLMNTVEAWRESGQRSLPAALHAPFALSHWLGAADERAVGNLPSLQVPG